MHVLEVLCFIKKNIWETLRKIEHNTRSKYDLHTQSRNTSLLQKSLLHMGV